MALRSGASLSCLEDSRDGGQTSRLNTETARENKTCPLVWKAEDRPESSKNLVSILMVKAGITLSRAVVHGHTTAALLLWGRVLHMHLQVTVPRCSQSCAYLPHFAHFQKVQFKCQI